MLFESLLLPLGLQESPVSQFIGLPRRSCTNKSKASTDGTGLLWSEVKGGVLLLLVEVTDCLPLLLVGDGKNPGNGLADGVTAWHNLVFFEKRSK